MSTKMNIADFLPRYTGAELLEEAKRNRIEGVEGLPLEEFIIDLPDNLARILDIGMSSIDYHKLQETDIAMTMRCLAAVIVSLEKKLSEITE